MKSIIKKHFAVICITSFSFLIMTVSGCGKKEEPEQLPAINYIDTIPIDQQPVIMRDEKAADESDNSDEAAFTETSTEPESTQEIIPYADRISGENPVSYNIEAAVYEEGAINVKYPQLAAMSNTELQQQINENIKNSIISGIYTEGLDSYEMSYDTATMGTGLVSFIFNGYVNYQNSAHPSRVVKTLNIDLNTGRNIRLKDYADIAVVVSCLEQQNGYSIVDSGVDAADFSAYLNNGAVTDYALTLLDYDIDFSNPDLICAGFSAIRNNRLVLFVAAEHSMGDYVELEFDKDL